MKKKTDAIGIKNLSKTYSGSQRPALADVSLNIGPGDRVGLIGGNGSGKTTLLRLIMNFLVPNHGSIEIFGQADLEKARHHLGFLPERQSGLENFTPRELLAISARMYSLAFDKAAQRSADLLLMTDLTGVADRLLAGFSKGMAQRVQICNALIHEPSILLLDEPMSGLDPQGQREVGTVLKQLDDLTLIYATHQLTEIEEYCTRAVILHRGRIVQQIDLRNMSEEIYTLDLTENGAKLLREISGFTVSRVNSRNNLHRLQFKADPDHAQAILAKLGDAGERVRRLRSQGMLENLYLTYVKGENDESISK